MNIKNITLKSEGYNSFNIPFNLLGNVKIINKSDGGRRVIAGYANLAVVDSDNQLIPTEVLQAGIETLMSDPAYANLMLFHKNIQIGKILSEYGELKTHVDDNGLYIICEIRKDTETANEAWNLILKGEINGFSIGCEVIDKHNRCDTEGKNCIEVLDKINIFEVSITSSPINEMSGFVVISKSKYDEGIDLQDYKNVCDECGINRDIMSKKKTNSKVLDKETEDEKKSEEDNATETTTEEKTEEKSVEDRIGDMERSIANINATIEKLSEIMNPVDEEKSEKDEDKSDDKETKSEEKTEETTEPVTTTEPEEKSDSTVIDKLDAIQKSISDLVESIKAEKVVKEEKSAIDELKLDLKSRDDQIEALNKKIEILTKSKDEKKESKTVQTDEDEDTTNDLIEEAPFLRDHDEIIFYNH